jgi:hypothetical protein
VILVICASVRVARTVQTTDGADAHLFGRHVRFGIVMTWAAVWTPLVYLQNVRWFGAIVPQLRQGAATAWRGK